MLPKIDEEFDEKVDSLKEILVKKLITLTKGKTSQGVKDFMGNRNCRKGS
jgi:DNA-directed RNA polymerase subunit beta